MSNCMKNAFSAIAALALTAMLSVFLPCIVWASEYPENDNLSKAEINERDNQIHDQYGVGDSIIGSDRDFILRYGVTPLQMSTKIGPLYETMSTQNFSACKSLYGTTVQASGNLYHESFMSYTYGGNIKVQKTYGPTPKKYHVVVHCDAYAPFGDDTIGKIYDGDATADATNTNTFNASPARSYGGYTLTYFVSCNIDVTTGDGSFFTMS